MALISKKQKVAKESKTDRHKFIQSIIDNTIKPEVLKDKLTYPREYKILQKLLKKYPDKRIWKNIDFKLNSLAFFLTSKGKEEIEKILNKLNFKVKEKEAVEIGSEKVGEKIEVEKVLTLKEFLRR